MADTETAWFAGSVGAAIVMAVKEVGMGIIKALRRKASDDKQARADAKAENAERDQWDKIGKIEADLNQHRIDDAAAFATLNANQSTIIEAVRRIETKVDIIHRRSTDKQ